VGVNSIDAAPEDISFNGQQILWVGSTDDKLYKNNGTFTTTILDSEDVTGIDLIPTGIEVNDFEARTEGIAETSFNQFMPSSHLMSRRPIYRHRNLLGGQAP
jgi:hypothetical protein